MTFRSLVFSGCFLSMAFLASTVYAADQKNTQKEISFEDSLKEQFLIKKEKINEMFQDKVMKISQRSSLPEDMKQMLIRQANEVKDFDLSTLENKLQMKLKQAKERDMIKEHLKTDASKRVQWVMENEKAFQQKKNEKNIGQKNDPETVKNEPAPLPPAPAEEMKPAEVVPFSPAPAEEMKPVEAVVPPPPASAEEMKPVDAVIPPPPASAEEMKPVDTIVPPPPAPTEEMKPVDAVVPPPPASAEEMKPVEAVIPPLPAPAEEMKPVDAVVPPPPAPTEEMKPVDAVVPPPPAPTEEMKPVDAVVPPPPAPAEEMKPVAPSLGNQEKDMSDGLIKEMDSIQRILE